MNKIEQKFLTLVRSNRVRSFMAAHKNLDDISTPVLKTAATELVSRARYLYITDTVEKASHANQMANQIAGVLQTRNEDIADLNTKINENAEVF